MSLEKQRFSLGELTMWYPDMCAVHKMFLDWIPCQAQDDNEVGYAYLRSTMSFLISAMALAGFKPLGQVFEQFMMVWQR